MNNVVNGGGIWRSLSNYQRNDSPAAHDTGYCMLAAKVYIPYNRLCPPPPPPRTDYFDIGSECSRDFDQSSNFGNPLDIVRLIDFPSTCHSIYIYSLVSLDYEISCIRIVITKLIYLTGRWRKEDIDT